MLADLDLLPSGCLTVPDRPRWPHRSESTAISTGVWSEQTCISRQPPNAPALHGKRAITSFPGPRRVGSAARVLFRWRRHERSYSYSDDGVAHQAGELTIEFVALRSSAPAEPLQRREVVAQLFALGVTLRAGWRGFRGVNA